MDMNGFMTLKGKKSRMSNFNPVLGAAGGLHEQPYQCS